MKRLHGIAARSACDITENESTNSNATEEWLQLKSIPAYIYKMAHAALMPSSETNVTVSSKPKYIYLTHLHDIHQNANAA